ncbi:hypothetical protein ACHAQJ_001212 [Trichoderma viride]
MTKILATSLKRRPTAALTLSPTYASESPQHGRPAVPTGIHVTMQLSAQNGRFCAGSALLTHVLNSGSTPAAQYDSQDLCVTDKSCNRLSLRQDDSNNWRTWYLTDDPADGHVTISFFAPARSTDKNTIPAPRIDLRRDANGGLVGQGKGFIPVVPDESRLSKETNNITKPEEWEVSVEWNLEDAPSGTRGACSFGDDAVSRAKGPFANILSTIFAVGLLQRHPPWGSSTHISIPGLPSAHSDFAVYWIGKTVYDMETLPSTVAGIYQSTASFFSSANPFRVFIRQVENGQGGTGASNSFLLEYSLSAKSDTTSESTAELLAHETIHEYALLDADETGDTEPEVSWYIEGIAEYYGAIVPYRGGVSNRQQLMRTLNGFAQSYYTNPVRGVDYGYVLSHYWDTVYITRVSYALGFMYMAAENARIREATGGVKCFDDVAMGLYHRRVAGKSNTLDDYHTMVAELVGKDEEKKNYTSMYRGDIIIPPADCFADLGLKMVRQDAEKFELGFDSESLRVNVIRDVVKGSRAQKAGVLEGDKVVAAGMAWVAANKLDNLMQITVLRDGKEKLIRWWPRSDEKVECWVWVEADEEAQY